MCASALVVTVLYSESEVLLAAFMKYPAQRAFLTFESMSYKTCIVPNLLVVFPAALNNHFVFCRDANQIFPDLCALRIEGARTKFS